MCGLAGIVDLKGARAVDRDALKRMIGALAHRGPDGEGLFVAPGVGLGHRRLAIIDREGGAQPFKIASRKGALVYNGEIYNYDALARDLRAAGAALSTRSDTEVLAEGFALSGPSFLPRLRGMFAFAYWDVGKETLTLCRDRLGEKPLYYAHTDDGFLIFASEIGALAASGLVPLDLDDEALADYFFYGFIPDPKSIFARIRKLPPASVLVARRGDEPRLETWWRPSFEPGPHRSLAEAAEELRILLDDAVRAQMISDEPLGAFLSGGLDSSAVVASMARTGAGLRTCAVGFDADGHDERAHARMVAERFGAAHDEDVVALDAAALVDEIARAYGEPFADASALPTFVVSQMTRRRVTVALSGDGGDELFAGYRRHGFFLAEERARALAPGALRGAVFGPAGALYPKLDRAPRPLRLKTTLQALAMSSGAGYAHAMAANRPDRMRRLMSQDLKRALGDYRPEAAVESAMGDAREHPLVAAQRADLSVWLAGRMLVKVDRASMAHGLEVRPPLLDHPIVEWACRLDPALRLHNGESKRVLRAAMRERLPEEILHRKKQGFAPPLAEWMRDAEGPAARLSASKLWRQCGYLDPKAVEAMIAAHRRGAADCGQELWSVVMFDAFLRAATDFA